MAIGRNAEPEDDAEGLLAEVCLAHGRILQLDSTLWRTREEW